jgi:hypothetical protein
VKKQRDVGKEMWGIGVLEYWSDGVMVISQ